MLLESVSVVENPIHASLSPQVLWTIPRKAYDALQANPKEVKVTLSKASAAHLPAMDSGTSITITITISLDLITPSSCVDIDAFTMVCSFIWYV